MPGLLLLRLWEVKRFYLLSPAFQKYINPLFQSNDHLFFTISDNLGVISVDHSCIPLVASILRLIPTRPRSSSPRLRRWPSSATRPTSARRRRIGASNLSPLSSWTSQAAKPSEGVGGLNDRKYELEHPTISSAPFSIHKLSISKRQPLSAFLKMTLW